MSYRDILVYLDPSSDGDNRLDLAASLARAHGARLIGVDVSSEAAFEGRWRDRTVALQDVFEARIKAAGIKAEFRNGDRARNAVGYAHYADLLVASQPEFETRDLVLSTVPEDVLLRAGVPMLILPYEWRPQPVGECIVIAWNASREATRALHDAMPMLKRAQKVTIFEFGPGKVEFRSEPQLILDHLRQHDVKAEIDTWPDTGDLTPVEALFACLDTQEADLIVAGAYGHSRLMEGLFGGASHDLIRQPSLPVLMSH